MYPYAYDRARHLPHILRVPRDWLGARDPAIGALIVRRLERALAAASPHTPRGRSLRWALAGERSRL